MSKDTIINAEFKSFAKNLKKELTKVGLDLSHGATLNLLARTLKHSDYNTYVASANNPLNIDNDKTDDTDVVIIGYFLTDDFKREHMNKLFKWIDSYGIDGFKDRLFSIFDRYLDKRNFKDTSEAYLRFFDVFIFEFASEYFINNENWESMLTSYVTNDSVSFLGFHIAMNEIAVAMGNLHFTNDTIKMNKTSETLNFHPFATIHQSGHKIDIELNQPLFEYKKNHSINKKQPE